MGNIARNINGQVKFINDRPLEIIEELQASIEWLQNSYDNACKTIEKMKEETYKDSEIARLRKDNQELREEMKYGYPVTKDEWEKIKEWKDDWFRRKRNGDTYMGAIGGGFVYQFHPTGIGIIAKVIAPDGEEFKFRNDL